MKKNNILLTALAAVLILSLSIGSALAYFTDWTDADGGETVHAGSYTTIEEPKVENWIKHIVIKNTSDDVCVFVRAKAYSTFNLTYSGSSWTAGSGGYYYYGGEGTEILLGPKGSVSPDPSDTAAELLVTITPPEKPQTGDNFNVTVIYEAVQARYKDDGTAYADWTQPVQQFQDNS